MVSIKDKLLMVLRDAQRDPAYHGMRDAIASLTQTIEHWQEPQQSSATPSPGRRAAVDAAKGDSAPAPVGSHGADQRTAPGPDRPPGGHQGKGPGAVPASFAEAGQAARDRLAAPSTPPNDNSARGANSPPPQFKRRGRRGATAQGG